MQPQLSLGVEGGGTKTEWVLVSLPGNAIVKTGRLPAANFKLITEDALTRLLDLLPRDVANVGVFLAGCATGQDRARLHAIVEKIWPHAKLAVGSDRDSGFAAAFGNGDGITVIAGTGSAVTGRKNGVYDKAGGWGQLLGDKGGGYNIAVGGLRMALSCYDLEHRITPLAHKILRTLSLNRLPDLVDWATNADKMSVAKLAPVIFEAAHEGDVEMFEVLRSGAGTLADYVNAVAGRLEMKAPEVKLLGGLFATYEIYRKLFAERLHKILPRAKVSLCVESGATGAAWLAANSEPLYPAPQPETSEHAIPELARAATEQVNPRSTHIAELPTRGMIELFLTEEAEVTRALEASMDALCSAVDTVAAAMKNGGRLFYAGAGTSGRLGVLDASEIPPTFGVSPALVQGIIAGGPVALHQAVEGAEDQREMGALAVIERGVKKGDVVCGITASGRTPFVLGALERARNLGARTMLLTCNPLRDRGGTAWDVEIDLPTGPELIAGSTRLKAGTATKLTLNILSTCAMVRLGRTEGNRMVDFAKSNAKLRDRAVRALSAARGISYEHARELLENSGWDLRGCLRASEKNPAA